MQIVIDINELDFEVIKEVNELGGEWKTDIAGKCMKAIANGTPLPKGHGNLIQREDAEAIFKNARKALYEQSRKERINDFQTRELMLLNAEQFVHLVQPIIGADNTESEGNE